jgi:hypothetical protein
VTPLMLFWALSSSVAARLIVRLGLSGHRADRGPLHRRGLHRPPRLRAVSTLPWPGSAQACAVVGWASIHGLEPGPRRPARDRGGHSRRGHEPRAVLPDGGRVSRGCPGRAPFVRPHGGSAPPRPETAGRLLAGGSRTRPRRWGLDPLLLRQALEHALLPVFAVLLGLALLNLFVAGFSGPGRREGAPVPAGPARSGGAG